ncbi:MAG: OmpA family protein [Minicystis sp.]
MRFRSFARAITVGFLLVTAPSCMLFQKPECPKKKYEPPDERFVFFTLGKTDLVPDGFYSIGYVAAQLDADPALQVLVVGHADQRGRADANKELSFKRARVVRKVLLEHGIKEVRVRVAAPREQSDTTLAQLSRRVDLFVFDPAQDDAAKRVGYPVDIKAE